MCVCVEKETLLMRGRRGGITREREREKERDKKRE